MADPKFGFIDSYKTTSGAFGATEELFRFAFASYLGGWGGTGRTMQAELNVKVTYLRGAAGGTDESATFVVGATRANGGTLTVDAFTARGNAGEFLTIGVSTGTLIVQADGGSSPGVAMVHMTGIVQECDTPA
jgi:hypothetical protein